MELRLSVQLQYSEAVLCDLLCWVPFEKLVTAGNVGPRAFNTTGCCNILPEDTGARVWGIPLLSAQLVRDTRHARNWSQNMAMISDQVNVFF